MPTAVPRLVNDYLAISRVSRGLSPTNPGEIGREGGLSRRRSFSYRRRRDETRRDQRRNGSEVLIHIADWLGLKGAGA